MLDHATVLRVPGKTVVPC